MARYFEVAKDVVERHGGTVEKFIGDAVMAVFGVPNVHEDDALRAVRAAGEMREALVALNKELERDHGVSLAARIGVNTGEVVAGDPQGQTLVTGDAVNVTARLEQAADPGSVLLGGDTMRLVRDAVAAEPVDPLVLKGKSDPIPAFRLAEETFWAVRRFLESVAQAGPLAVVFDDIQWGEPTFLDLIEHIADWTRDAPILVLCMARPELLDARPVWGGGKFNAATISLERLSDADCGELIANLLRRAALPDEARVRILEAAEGTPLFVEEMLSMLIDDGLLVLEGDRWIATGDLGAVSVPPTIQALLAARLDRLSAD